MRAVGGFRLAGERLGQRRLARAVAADEPDLVALVDAEARRRSMSTRAPTRISRSCTASMGVTFRFVGEGVENGPEWASPLVYRHDFACTGIASPVRPPRPRRPRPPPPPRDRHHARRARCGPRRRIRAALRAAWPVPVTGQTLAVLLVGATLGAVRGALAMVVYAVVGIVGVPWFSEAAAGGASSPARPAATSSASSSPRSSSAGCRSAVGPQDPQGARDLPRRHR